MAVYRSNDPHMTCTSAIKPGRSGSEHGDARFYRFPFWADSPEKEKDADRDLKELILKGKVSKL